MNLKFYLKDKILDIVLQSQRVKKYVILFDTVNSSITAAAAAAAKSLQSCPTLCDPMDGSPPGSPVPGILQARTLEWVAIPFSNAWKWKVKVKLLSCVRLFATPWTATYQAPLSMWFSRQEYWSGVPLPSPPQSLGYTILQFHQLYVRLLVSQSFANRMLSRFWILGNLVVRKGLLI